MNVYYSCLLETRAELARKCYACLLHIPPLLFITASCDHCITITTRIGQKKATAIYVYISTCNLAQILLLLIGVCLMFSTHSMHMWAH